MTLTLWGAYFRPLDPLVQRLLAVTVSLERSASAGFALTSVVDAEGLAERAPGRVALRRAGVAIEYAISFESTAGARCSLVLVQSFRSATIRGITEISGTLVHGGESGPAQARLRINYRDVGAALRALSFRPHLAHP